MSKTLTVKLGGVYATEITAGTVTPPSATLAEASWLECTQFSVGSNGEIGEARLRAARHPKDIGTSITHGQVVQLEDSVSHAVVFNGVVVKLHSVINPTDTHFEAVVYNTGDFLRVSLYMVNTAAQTPTNKRTSTQAQQMVPKGTTSRPTSCSSIHHSASTLTAIRT